MKGVPRVRVRRRPPSYRRPTATPAPTLTPTLPTLTLAHHLGDLIRGSSRGVDHVARPDGLGAHGDAAHRPLRARAAHLLGVRARVRVRG